MYICDSFPSEMTWVSLRSGRLKTSFCMLYCSWFKLFGRKNFHRGIASFSLPSVLTLLIVKHLIAHLIVMFTFLLIFVICLLDFCVIFPDCIFSSPVLVDDVIKLCRLIHGLFQIVVIVDILTIWILGQLLLSFQETVLWIQVNGQEYHFPAWVA